MKKIFYKLFILGGLLSSTTLLSTSKSEKKAPLQDTVLNQKETTPLPSKKPNKTATKTKTLLTQGFPNTVNFFKDIRPLSLFKKPFKIPDINIPTKTEIQNFIEQQKKFITEEKKSSRYNVFRCLMAPTYLSESTLCHVDNNQIVQSKPMECFYFCSANALTIGYGLKIEFNGKELAPEGIKALETLDIKIDGQSLSLDEKKELAYRCIALRNQHDKKSATPLSKKLYEAQVPILFPKKKAVISKENALQTAQIEYMEKHKKLLEKNPFLERSFYSQALGCDLAYQFGNTGVTRCSYYKTTKNNIFPKEIKIGKGDRLKIRQFLCALDYKHAQDKKKRKGARPTLEEQNATTLFAVQKYIELFKKDIMARSSYHILLMENLMTIVMLQHQQDMQETPLLNMQINDCKKQARQLVYQDLFHSETILQLPNKLRPITMVDAVKTSSEKLAPWMQKSTLSLPPKEFMEKILLSEATKKVKLYNKRYKQRVTLKIPSENKSKIVTQSDKPR